MPDGNVRDSDAINQHTRLVTAECDGYADSKCDTATGNRETAPDGYCGDTLGDYAKRYNPDEKCDIMEYTVHYSVLTAAYGGDYSQATEQPARQ